MGLIHLGILAILGGSLLYKALTVVQADTVLGIYRAGRYSHSLKPGLHLRVPFLDTVVFRYEQRSLTLTYCFTQRANNHMLYSIKGSLELDKSLQNSEANYDQLFRLGIEVERLLAEELEREGPPTSKSALTGIENNILRALNSQTPASEMRILAVNVDTITQTAEVHRH